MRLDVFLLKLTGYDRGLFPMVFSVSSLCWRSETAPKRTEVSNVPWPFGPSLDHRLPVNNRLSPASTHDARSAEKTERTARDNRRSFDCYWSRMSPILKLISPPRPPPRQINCPRRSSSRNGPSPSRRSPGPIQRQGATDITPKSIDNRLRVPLSPFLRMWRACVCVYQ